MKKKILLLLPILTALFTFSCNKDDKQQINISFKQAEYFAYEDETFKVETVTNSKKTLKFSVENDEIASISSKGVVICKQPGDTKLYVTVEGITASSKLHIDESKESSCGIEVQAEKVDLSLKDKVSQKIAPRYYIIIDEKIYDDTKVFTYESSDESVFTVASDGTISAVAPGTANLLISTSGINKEIVVDVYNEFIATPEKWLNVLSTHQLTDGEAETGPYTSFDCFDYRALVTNDLDFTNTPYTCEDEGHGSKGYYPSLQRSQYYGFAGEINGGLHTLSNINFADVKYVDGKGNSGIQSLFGHLRGAYIHDLEFIDVKFTQPNCAMLAATDRCGTPSYSYNGGNKHITKVERVYIEATTAQCTAGLYHEMCGSTINDLVLKLRYVGAGTLTNTTSMLVRNLYNWDNGSVNNVILFTDDNEVANTVQNVSGQTNPLKMDRLMNTESKIEAAYFAKQYFSSTVWNIGTNDLPTLIK